MTKQGRGPGRPRKAETIRLAPAEITADHRRAAATVRDRLAERGINFGKLAEMAGLGRTTVDNFLNFRKSPELSTIRRIGTALDLPLADLVGAVTYPQLKQTPALPMRGGVHLGVRRSMALRDEPRGETADVQPRDERCRKLPRFGVPIDDDSLMGLAPPVPRGSVAIVADLTGSDLAIESGFYLVHQIKGDDVITGIWRITAYRDRYEFSPAAEPPGPPAFTMPREEVERGQTVEIAGILVATHSHSVSPAGNPVTQTVEYT